MNEDYDDKPFIGDANFKDTSLDEMIYVSCRGERLGGMWYRAELNLMCDHIVSPHLDAGIALKDVRHELLKAVINKALEEMVNGDGQEEEDG